MGLPPLWSPVLMLGEPGALARPAGPQTLQDIWGHKSSLPFGSSTARLAHRPQTQF